MSEKIIEKSVQQSYIEDMCRYSITANRRRAIPEVRDSLKPVARRSIFAMAHDNKCFTLSSKVKSASIVGVVMDKYHPHGDSSIYGTITPLANWWNTKKPLIGKQGNFGSIEGEGAAAMRYTEAYLSQFAIDCLLGGIKETPNIVDWSKTHNEATLEPNYFPATIPLLLVNGTFGIGTGIKVYIPSHNINEVIDATINLIKDPSAPVVLIPDQCMPCHIVDTNWKAICNTGSGKFYVRADIVSGTHNDGKTTKPALIIRALPDNVSALNVRAKILSLVDAGELPMVVDLLSESDENGLKVIIVLKPGSDESYVKEILYKKTECEKDFTVNFEVIDGIDPIRMSYKSYLQFFIEFAKMNKFRYFHNKLQDVLTKHHETDAYVKVLQSGEVDNIIKMIRNQKNTDENEMVEWLVKKIKITDLQAKFILRTQIQKLSKGNLDKYIETRKNLEEQIKYYDSRIKDDNLILQHVVDDLLEAKKKYGEPRICDVIKVSSGADVPQGTFKVAITENNYIRKIIETDTINTVKGDRPNFIMKVDNTENILIFDNKGKVFKLPVHKIPLCDKQNGGVDLRLMIKGFVADVVAVMYEPIVKEVSKNKLKHHIAIVTEGNYIKKLDLDDFLNISPSGMIYSKINQGDSVKSVEIIPDTLDVIVYSEHKALRFSMREVPLYKRITIGSYAMSTKGKVEGLSVVYPDATHMIVITKSGRINKFNISGLAKSGRYKAGSSVIKLGKQDSIYSIYGVNDSNTLKLNTNEGIIEIPVKDIDVGSSVSQGIKMISTKSAIILKSEVY